MEERQAVVLTAVSEGAAIGETNTEGSNREKREAAMG